MKSKLLIVLIILSVLFTLTSVTAADNQSEIISDSADYHPFSELNQSISESTGEINLEHDYSCGNTSIRIVKENEFVINGNGHILDGAVNSKPFVFKSNDVVVINNLTFQNFVNSSFRILSPVIFNNVSFINCTSQHITSFLYCDDYVQFDGCIIKDTNMTYKFICNYVGGIVFKNSVVSGGYVDEGIISVEKNGLIVENCTFENISSRLGSAINYKGNNITVKKSKFINLNASGTGGAIIAKFFSKDDMGNSFLIEDCEFTNVTASYNGGALYYDLDSGSDFILKTLDIVNTTFTNSKSRYGGAIVDLGGILNIVNSTIENSYAGYEGGAIYTSWARLNIINTTLSNNRAEKNAGAIYFDKGKLTIINSTLIGNEISNESGNAGRAIYAYDVNINFSNSTFDNGGISVYADFVTNKILENNTLNYDEFSLDNKNYIVSVESSGIKITLINNSIVVDELPSKFDSRDWGWVSPDKVQGDNDDCWAFATVASMESALLKSTGVLYNLSPNYVQKLQLKYARNGDLRISSTGFAYSGLGHALSWYGALAMDTPYEDRGMAADTDFSDSRIHLQDAMIIFGGKNDTVNMIKQAILKYGSVSVQMILYDGGEEIPTTGENISVFDHGIHFVSLVGWDDSTGKWTYKDSLGGFNTINYVSKLLLAPDRYAIVPQNAAITYIFENSIDYHVNYQSDLNGLTGFDGNYTYYSNQFTSKYDELIGAVGTYFNESGIDYSFDIYVNGVKVHTQSGVSEFAGFRTIVLNKYIPIKTGDEFKVVFKNNALPYQAYSRQHYVAGMSFISSDGENFKDITLENKTGCLKVYTVADDTKIINNKDITVNYNAGSYFSVKVVTDEGRSVGAGEIVKFTINGKTITAKTDDNGIAKIKITQIPKKYTITTSYNGKTYKNTVTVKKTTPKITAKTKTFKNAVKVKKYTITLKTNLNKVMKKVKVTLKVKGKTYTAKTNSKGKATFKINKLIRKGKFSAVIKFAGNKYYNKVSKTVKITVK